VGGGYRASLDRLDQRRTMRRIQKRWLPGAFRSIKPSAPAALNFTTQSRTICNVTPPVRAASVRLEPS